MPRRGTGSKVGGPRTSPPGRAHANRTDMNGPQPIRTAPGQPYGSRVAQERAQQAVPLPDHTGQPTSPTGGAPAQPAPGPGELTPLGAATRRTGEPITAGLPSGPGPGPEVLASAPMQHARSQLTRLAEESSDPFLVALARRAGGR